MNQYIKTILLLLLTVSTGNLYAKLQGQAKIDSLLKELPRQGDDTNKVKILNSLSATYYTINSDSGVILGSQGFQLATKLGWKKGLALSCNLLGVHYSTLNNYPTALDYYSKSMKLSEEIGNKQGIAGAIRNMVGIYLNQGEYTKALELNLKAVKVAEEMGDKKEISHQIGNVANIYCSMSNFSKALEFAFRSLKICEEIKDTVGNARATLVVGTVYMAQQDYPKARAYFLKARKLFEVTGTKDGMAAATGNIGITYIQENNHAEALQYLFKALHLSEELGDAQGIAQNTLSIGGAYGVMGDYANALAYEFEALKMEEDLGAWPNVCYSLGIIGKIYLSLAQDSVQRQVYVDPERSAGFKGKEVPKSKAEQLHLAISFLKRAVDSSGPLGVMEVLQTSSHDLAEAYHLAGRHDKALDAYKDYVRIKDSIFSQENEKKIMQQQMKYDYSKREDSIKLANAGREKVAALRYQRQRSYTLMGIGGILALGVFSFFMFRNNKLLAKEKNRSENLLLNILPAEVATQLKDTGTAAARNFDNVTILFTDFVNFTEASGRMKPEALIEELDTCFKKFDAITGKHNIEKIKTIGDAYLAVCGLPHADPEHALNIIRAAQEINTFMQDREAKLGNSTFKIRIGIHTGSVIAGIVGDKKFAYDIWGDTVNTAARMEQNSEAGKINISQATYELVKDKISCAYRGEIDAKGKGVMKMYYVSAVAFSA